MSAALATVAVLKLGTLAHNAKHRHRQEVDNSERYRKLVESVPAELWDIAVRIKTQRGVCAGASDAEVRQRQTLVRGRMRSRGYSESECAKYCQAVAALTLE